MSNTLIRIVDTETTGLDDPAEMVEFGFTDVKLTDDGWKIASGPHSCLVHPGMPITFGAMAVHHITQEEAELAGIDPEDARAIIVDGANILCAHNVRFDSRFIRGHSLPWICTYKCAKALLPDLQGHGNGSIRYELGLCLHDPKAYPPHRAGPDTWITAHFLIELLKTHTPEQLIEISSKPVLLKKIDFSDHRGKLFSEIDSGFLEWCVRKLANEPDKEDVVFTARAELAKRMATTTLDRNQPRLPQTDPDAWRKDVGRV